MKHTLRIGQPLSKHFREMVKRTARVLKRVSSPAAEVVSPHPAPPTPYGGGPQTVERRRHRAQRGRRVSDAVAPVSDAPRVLLVEPDQETRVLYSSLFEEAGYAVYAVAEGIEAIDVA